MPSKFIGILRIRNSLENWKIRNLYISFVKERSKCPRAKSPPSTKLSARHGAGSHKPGLKKFEISESLKFSQNTIYFHLLFSDFSFEHSFCRFLETPKVRDFEETWQSTAGTCRKNATSLDSKTPFSPFRILKQLRMLPIQKGHHEKSRLLFIRCSYHGFPGRSQFQQQNLARFN